MKKMLLRSAELMPEEHYAFKPTPDVRSFGELLGHTARTIQTWPIRLTSMCRRRCSELIS